MTSKTHNFKRKQMPSAGAALDVDDLGCKVKERLSLLPAVASVHFLPTETALQVWVGISDDDPGTRKAVYDLEDSVSEAFRSIQFDFHVVPMPTGRRMEDYVSTATPIFRRAAAA